MNSGLYPRVSDDPVDQLVFEREELVCDWWREEDQLRAWEAREWTAPKQKRVG